MKKCPYSTWCGGCKYQSIDYNEQLLMKQKRAEKLLSRFHHVEKILSCKNETNYRNKVQISFGMDEDRHVLCGYYLPDSHRIVPIDRCDLADERINRLIFSLKRIVISERIPIYDERRRKGCLRHILFRTSNTGEMMVVFVTGSRTLYKAQQLVKAVLHYNPDVTTIVHNINELPVSKVLGKRNHTLYGKGYITDKLCGLSFRISPSSFYQVNKYQTQVLYEEAIRLADLKENEVLIDAYCGTGTIGLTASRSVKKVIGVEIVETAIKDALINCKINGIQNAEFLAEDAGKYMEKLSRQNAYIDTVIMDPPRSGSDTRFLSCLTRLSPDKIIYISCNPDTLARDLKQLQKAYDVEWIQPVDMFPFTDHIECIVKLVRRPD
ncbi:MAG: 23S rRNA (uracil(1939)-C(5))-methyltransferase RlmD [Erysipelotrichaceae bacterium]|nr:23S rRNA (uracil(1939)-C(5))-methyltransferase RlmD [Erysipelotrichaceae bacterium]